MRPDALRLSVELSPEQVELIAKRAAEIVASQAAPPPPESPYLTISEAADYIRARRHRIDDLLSRGYLTRIKEGTRTLVSRAELEAYVRGEVRLARRAGRAAA
ncbi:MAG: helix-turn-helix domain-containing protein [Thermoleophilia bacterium]